MRRLFSKWIAENLLLGVIYEITGDAVRARQVYEVVRRTHGRGLLWRWALPASFLLGEATEDDLWRNTMELGLLGSAPMVGFLSAAPAPINSDGAVFR